MGTPKCESTGHFFVSNPQHVTPFLCFVCRQRFSASYSSLGTSKQSSSHSRSSSWAASHRQPQTPLGTRDESSLAQSKPWRCLVEKCLILACDKCSDLLCEVGGNGAEAQIIHNFLKDPMDSSRNSLTFGMEYEHRPGEATPDDQRKGNTIENIMKLEVDDLPAKPNSGSESDEEQPPKLIYRRAGCAADSALASHYHRRLPRRSVNKPTQLPPSFDRSRIESPKSQNRPIADILAVDDNPDDGRNGIEVE